MSSYRQISPEELTRSPFSLIGKDWILITASDASKESGVNAMTASWGGLGILWNKPVATIYVRPQRHTFTLVNECERLSLCFMPDSKRDVLKLCGVKSGKDTDKLKQLGLSVTCEFGAPAICESEMILICKKAYSDDIKEANFNDTDHLKHYENKDFHRFYILEIEKILVKE